MLDTEHTLRLEGNLQRLADDTHKTLDRFVTLVEDLFAESDENDKQTIDDWIVGRKETLITTLNELISET